MEHTQIEGIKQECLTLATRTKHLANNLEVMAQELHQITQKIDDLTLKISNLEYAKPIDFENPELIEEWVSDYGYDFESDFFDAVNVDLEANGYGDELTISAVKEVNDSERNDTLTKAIEKYLEWAKNQKETQAQEGSENEY